MIFYEIFSLPVNRSLNMHRQRHHNLTDMIYQLLSSEFPFSECDFTYASSLWCLHITYDSSKIISSVHRIR